MPQHILDPGDPRRELRIINWTALLLFGAVGVTPMIISSIFVDWKISIAIGLVVMAFSLKRFIVSVPEVTGLYTTDAFTGKIRTYGPGLAPIFPWERFIKRNFINTRLDPFLFTETFQSKDGALFRVRWTLQGRPIIARLAQYIAVNLEEIKDGIGEVGNAFLSADFNQYDWAEVKARQSRIGKDLDEYFRGPESENFEDLYGIETPVIKLSDVDFSEKFQEARENQLAHERYAEAARKLVRDARDEGRDMSYQDAMHTVLATAKRADLRIVHAGGTGVEGFVATLGSILGKDLPKGGERK